MGSQYLLASSDSPENITVKFEHCSTIWIQIENMYSRIPLSRTLKKSNKKL